jgi:hypothetical protein
MSTLKNIVCLWAYTFKSDISLRLLFLRTSTVKKHSMLILLPVHWSPQARLLFVFTGARNSDSSSFHGYTINNAADVVGYLTITWLPWRIFSPRRAFITWLFLVPVLPKSNTLKFSFFTAASRFSTHSFTSAKQSFSLVDIHRTARFHLF